MQWSSYQQSIFDAVQNTNDNIAINAVAGSGKTTVLVECAKRVPVTASVAFVAFNSHIVGELKSRLGKNCDCRTIHSLGNGALYKGKKLILSQYKMHKIIDELMHNAFWLPTGMYDAFLPIIRDVADKARVTLTDLNRQSSAEQMLSHYGIDAAISVLAYEHDQNPSFLKAKAIDTAQRAIGESLRMYQEEQIIDFTDMLYIPYELNLYTKKFDVVLVDECQDLNKAQLSLVLKAARQGGRVIFVGDRNQAIQGFAGADNNSFDNVVRASNAKEMPLSICYRCPKSHVEMARELVPQIESSPTAIDGTVKHIGMSDFYELPSFGDLIISRRNAPLIGTAFRLISRGVQARIRGRDIATGLVKLIKAADKVVVDGDSGKFSESFPAKLKVSIRHKIDLLDQSPDSEAPKELLQDQLDCILAFMSGRPDIQTNDQLCTEIQKLFADDGASVWLSSIHRAKGLESDRVFILDAENIRANCRLHWQREQELNLEYVALTRSKNELHLVYKN